MMDRNLFAPTQHTSAEGPKRVLVVDDDGVARLHLKLALASEFSVVEARDGVEAMDLLSGSSDFACIVTDDRMPKASGFDVVKYVREHAATARIPVVLMTASDTNSAKRQVEGQRLGASAYLNKPFTPAQALKLVQMLARTIAPNAWQRA